MRSIIVYLLLSWSLLSHGKTTTNDIKDEAASPKQPEGGRIELDVSRLLRVTTGAFSKGEKAFFAKSKQDMQDLYKKYKSGKDLTKMNAPLLWVNYALTQAMDRPKPMFSWYSGETMQAHVDEDKRTRYWPAFLLPVKQQTYPLQQLLHDGKPVTIPPTGPSSPPLYPTLDPLLCGLLSNDTTKDENGLPSLWPANTALIASNCGSFVFMALAQALPNAVKTKLTNRSKFPDAFSYDPPTDFAPVHQQWYDEIGFPEKHELLKKDRLRDAPPGRMLIMWYSTSGEVTFDPKRDSQPKGYKAHVGMTVDPTFCRIQKKVNAMCVADLMIFSTLVYARERQNKNGPIDIVPPRLTPYAYKADPTLRSFARISDSHLLTTAPLGPKFAAHIKATMVERWGKRSK